MVQHPYPTSDDGSVPQDDAEAKRMFVAYFEASIREIIPVVYPKRHTYHTTQNGQLWDIEYQAVAFADQFADTLENVTDENRPAILKMFSEALLQVVKAKIERKDVL